MGSYVSYKLDAEVDKDVEAAICKAFNNHKSFDNRLPTFEQYFWRKFSEETKFWFAPVVIEISKQFPTVMFRLDAKGDETFTSFICNGYEIDEKVLFPQPKYPAMTKFNEVKECREARRIAAQRAKDLAEADKQIAELEKKKKELLASM